MQAGTAKVRRFNTWNSHRLEADGGKGKRASGCRRGLSSAMPACLRDTSPAAPTHMQSASGSVSREGGHEAGACGRFAVWDGAEGKRWSGRNSEGERWAGGGTSSLECVCWPSQTSQDVYDTSVEL